MAACLLSVHLPYFQKVVLLIMPIIVKVIIMCLHQCLVMPALLSRFDRKVLHTNFWASNALQDCAFLPSQSSACIFAGDWAAFMTASAIPAPPQATATAATSSTGTAAPVIISQDSGWDAFQSGDAAPSSVTAATALFDPFGSSHAAEAAVLMQAAQPSAAPAKHAPKRSADDIMKMFDTPQQNAFANFPAQGASVIPGQQQMGGFGSQSSNGMMPGAMYGMNPQQMMQMQQMYAAQGMQTSGLQQGAFNAFPIAPNAAGPWGSQQGALPSFAGIPQQYQHSNMAAPGKVPQ